MFVTFVSRSLLPLNTWCGDEKMFIIIKTGSSDNMFLCICKPLKVFLPILFSLSFISKNTLQIGLTGQGWIVLHFFTNISLSCQKTLYLVAFYPVSAQRHYNLGKMVQLMHTWEQGRSWLAIYGLFKERGKDAMSSQLSSYGLYYAPCAMSHIAIADILYIRYTRLLTKTVM